jgi:hypothetical protein
MENDLGDFSDGCGGTEGTGEFGGVAASGGLVSAIDSFAGVIISYGVMGALYPSQICLGVARGGQPATFPLVVAALDRTARPERGKTGRGSTFRNSHDRRAV